MEETPPWMHTEPQPPVDLQVDRPHGARVYDYLLGGKTNYAADREQAEKILESIPSAVASAKENRAFIHRAARHLVREEGIRQFLDIGTGIPTSPNLHEVAQSLDPSARVVYADNDPIVLTHCRALHSSSPEGATACLQADATEPERILASPELHGTLDLQQPVAITLGLLLHWLPDGYDAYGMVRTLLDAVPEGSALVITHVTKDFDERAGRIEEDFKGTGSSVRTRTKEEAERFFDGLEFVDPGLSAPQHWRPGPVRIEAGDRGVLNGTTIPIWAGVALKPAA
ncbi:SAM-dependent methyltransferase [Streptomyces sp. WMMB 322]|uniref:SAM-dependent methyltransferase n=1 Tax=Streptomyces sp. WMMB 322 TaxID=1286821 RepID=UPI0006E2ED77|nr:SAM-dependent methyltransferase [Streptomyces sp. WMMB 322]SCK45770.1 S-adenosyl methyltransferase [Streptomyces sp. WMMB 322]